MSDPSPVLSPLDGFARELSLRTRALRRGVAVTAALAVTAAAVLGASVAFHPDLSPSVRFVFRAVPWVLAVCAWALAPRQVPRDRAAGAAVGALPPLLSAALDRHAQPTPPGESPALRERWYLAAAALAPGVSRHRLSITVARRSIPALAVAVLAVCLPVTATDRTVRGLRALFVPGAEPDGARVGPVATLDQIEVRLAGRPVRTFQPHGTVLEVPRGALVVLHGRTVRPSVAVALRAPGARAPEAMATPDASGRFALAWMAGRPARLALESDEGAVRRVRQRPALVFTATADAPPAADWTDGDGDVVLDLSPAAQGYTVTDDRGIARVNLVIARDGRELRRPLAWPEPGITRLDDTLTLEPMASLARTTIRLEAVDDSGHIGLSAPRRVAVRTALDRRIARADGLRRALESLRALARARTDSPVGDSPTAAADRVRVLADPTHTAAVTLGDEASAAFNDPRGDHATAMAMADMADQVQFALESDRALADPVAAPQTERTEANAEALRALTDDIARLSTALDTALDRAAHALAAGMRGGGRGEMRGGMQREAAGERLAALARAAGEDPTGVGARARTARAALQGGASVADAAGLLAPPTGEGGDGGPRNPALERLATEVPVRLAEARELSEGVSRAESSGALQVGALGVPLALTARLGGEVAHAEGASGGPLAARVADLRAALRGGDLATARAVLNAMDAHGTLPSTAWASRDALDHAITVLEGTRDAGPALRALAPRGRTAAGVLHRLRTAVAGRIPGRAERLVALADNGAREGAAGMTARALVPARAGEAQAVAALEALLAQMQSEGTAGGDDSEENRDGEDGDREDGAGTASAHGRVELPPPEAFEAPRERRRAVVDGLRDGVPSAWAPAARRYARWLLR